MGYKLAWHLLGIVPRVHTAQADRNAKDLCNPIRRWDETSNLTSADALIHERDDLDWLGHVSFKDTYSERRRLPRIPQAMLTFKSMRIVIMIRKMTVTRLPTVRTHAGGGGVMCGEDVVEFLSLVLLLEVGGFGPGGGGGERETSIGPGRRTRGRIVREMCRCGTESQNVMLVEVDPIE